MQLPSPLKSNRNFNGLFTFYCVAISGPSMKVAAKRLGVSIPTVSEAIKRLERDIGFDVVDTKIRATFITDEGLELLERLRPGFQAFEAFFIETGRMNPIERISG